MSVFGVGMSRTKYATISTICLGRSSASPSVATRFLAWKVTDLSELQSVLYPRATTTISGNNNSVTAPVSNDITINVIAPTSKQWSDVAEKLVSDCETRTSHLEDIQTLSAEARRAHHVDGAQLQTVQGVVGMDLPSDYTKNRSYAYLIALGFDDDRSCVVVKYGKTEDLHERCYETHKRNFPHSVVLAVIDLSEYSATVVEASLKVATQQRRVRVRKGGIQHKECFTVIPEHLGTEINKLLLVVLRKHNAIIHDVMQCSTIQPDNAVVCATEYCRVRQAKMNALRATLDAEAAEQQLKLLKMNVTV